MVSPKFRSHRFRKVFVRTPGAKTVIHHLERKIGSVKCAICKKPLKGIPKRIGSKFKNLPKSQKVVSRYCGGNMCSTCVRQKIKENARLLK